MDRRPGRRPIVTAFILLLLLALPESRAAAEPPHIGYVESQLYPIRVYYNTAEDSQLAQEVLLVAEPAWQFQIVELGFQPPITKDAAGEVVEGFWVYFDRWSLDTAEHLGDNPHTPWTDCTTYGVISPDTELRLEEQVVVVLNETALAATDCIESPFAWKATLTAVVSKTLVPWYNVVGYLQTFQESLRAFYPYFPFYSFVLIVLLDL